MSTWVFQARDDGTFVARLDAAERAVLLEAVDEVVRLLGGDMRPEATMDPLASLRLDVGPVAAPADPALRRLLPDVSKDDADVAAEFRRLTEDDLRDTKVGNLLLLRSRLLDARRGIVVTPGQAPGVAAALTDLRLVLAERLGVRTEADADAVYRLVAEGDPVHRSDRVGMVRRRLAIISTVLGVLQDSLVEHMLSALPDDEAADQQPPSR